MRHYLFCLLMALPLCFTACSSDDNDSTENKGKKYLDLRTFYTTDEGASWLPTKKGITLSPDNLELLKDAIEQAMSEFADGE